MERRWSCVCLSLRHRHNNIDWTLLSAEEDSERVDAHTLAFLQSLLQSQPDKRLGSKSACSHPFFDGVDWDAVYRDTPAFVPVLDNEEDVS